MWSFTKPFLEIGGKLKEELVKLLKLCFDGKNGIVDAEVKVYVVSFQKTSPLMFTYFFVVGVPHTIN